MIARTDVIIVLLMPMLMLMLNLIRGERIVLTSDTVRKRDRQNKDSVDKLLNKCRILN